MDLLMILFALVSLAYISGVWTASIVYRIRETDLEESAPGTYSPS